jgi:preprotein translocase subunit SecA
MWPLTRSKSAELPGQIDDFLWLDSRGRETVLAAEVDRVLASGSHLVLTGHHAPTLESACAMLTDTPRALELVEAPTIPAALAQLLHQCAAPTCVVVNAGFLQAGPSPGAKWHTGLKVIVLGRHPLRHFDDAIVSYALQVTGSAEVVFSVSLDDPLMMLYSGPNQRTKLQRLGTKDDDIITHPWLTSSIRRSQTKVQRFIERRGEITVEGLGTLTREHLPPTLRR